MKPKKPIESLILNLRGQKVILDADLAELYDVPTFRFNEAFKRNRERFPDDFAFQLTAEEFAEWYKCPKAALKKGEAVEDPTNWSTDAELRAGKTRWYFVGTDSKGKRVKGEAVIELKAEIDPKKPKDPE